MNNVSLLNNVGKYMMMMMMIIIIIIISAIILYNFAY